MAKLNELLVAGPARFLETIQGNIATADKAIYDSSGKIIASTYLPLSGGTMTGRITANGKLSLPTSGTSWVNGMTLTNASIAITTQQTSGSYHPILAVKTYNSHVVNLGGINDYVGFYGYKAGRTENATDWSFRFDASTGNITHTGSITSSGGFIGNASTATKLATAKAIQTNLASTSSAPFDGSANITPGVTGTLAIGNGGTGATSAINALANLDARYRWTATVKCATWSRLCYVAFQASVVGAKYILNIGATRNSVVYNDTFLVTAHHSSNGKIIKLAGHNYSNGYQVRLLVDSSGNSYFELYDNCNSATNSTTQTVYCNLFPISTGAVTRYTSFTDGSTLPTNFTVKQTMTVDNTDIQANLSGNATTATTATKLGSSTVGGTAKPIYLNAGTATACSSTVGSTTQPVYMNGGTVTACTYTLGKSVPSNAVFTDTTYSAATTSAAGLMSASDKSKLDGIASGANAYSLPTATSSTLGGVKIGSNITVSSGTISLSKANVTSALGYTPPTTNTNTTYSLSLSGTTITLTGSDGSTSSITLPTYDGTVVWE